MNPLSYRTILLAMILMVALAIVGRASAEQTLFPTNLPGRQWIEFRADGFSKPVCGVVYRLKDTVTCGMALGGIDTGCIDLETTGLLGYCSLFNTDSPRRGPVNLPVLGLSVGGRTWVLCDKQPKKDRGDFQLHNGPYTKDLYQDFVNPLLLDLKLEGVRTAKEIHYWGHYPVADIEFETDAPVSVGLRAWSPFIPGDVASSMIPGIVFEVRLRNTTGSAQRGTIAFSFPGPTEKEAGTSEFERHKISGPFSGLSITSDLASYALGVIGKEKLRTGGELGADGQSWAQIASSLPESGQSSAGASAAVDFSLGAGKSRVVRFVLSWSAPTWKGGGYNWSNIGHTYTHMYAKHYPAAQSAAESLARNHKSLLARILAWQQVVYAEKKLPAWLRVSLISNLYMVTECGMWDQAKPPMPSWVKPEDGLFGMSESPRDNPQIECIPCSFYGNLPIVYFFPKLALSTLRGYKGYMEENGNVPWTFGGWARTDFANHNHGVQTSLNGICFAAMVDRYRMCWGDDAFVREFYDSVKRNAVFTVNLRPEYEIGDRIISMQSKNKYTENLSAHWFEATYPGFYGMVAHVGGIHLAQIEIARRMAEQVGDKEFVRQCDEWIAAGKKSLETKMWNGDNYLLFWEPETDKRCDLIFAHQLDGEWIAHFHGLPGIFRRDRVKTALEKVKQCNVPLGKGGVVAFANPDGTYAKGAGYGEYSCFIAEALMLAMQYIYEGQPEVGMDVAHKVFSNLILDQGYEWDMPVMTRGWENNGVGVASDYYQVMMLWALPAAIEGKVLSDPCKPGGLVDRILKAGRLDRRNQRGRASLQPATQTEKRELL
ncbi:MAG: hypothetical protein HYX78_07660 [Armatimonadetes bacterium]|nr:hypothetical protein [Armatimonadota bacterium]